MRFVRRNVGPHRSSEKRPRSFVSAPQSIAAAEPPKIRLSRDFGYGPIFDFCNGAVRSPFGPDSDIGEYFHNLCLNR